MYICSMNVYPLFISVPEVMIVGLVVDAESEESIKRATIEYLGEDVSAQASSDVNGEFRSYKFEPGKELKLRITHPDYEPAEVTATVQEGEIPLNIALKALPVLMLGGFTSIPGAIVGGLIIGVGEKLFEFLLGPMLGGATENWFAYVLALLFLVFRPQGLFGERIIERV